MARSVPPDREALCARRGGRRLRERHRRPTPRVDRSVDDIRRQPHDHLAHANDFISNGPTPAELTAAKQNIVGGFAMRFDTNKELANYVAMIGFYDLPLDYLDTFQKNIENVTIAEITDAFKRRINPQLLQTVTVGQATTKSAK